LPELVRVLGLRGAAILLYDGEVVAHGTIAIEELARRWSRDPVVVPARRFAASQFRELPVSLASALTASDVVAVVPIVSPRQQWGCAFVSTDLRGASFGAEDDGALGGFADQLALALDAAALLTRAVAVERSLAHAEKLATIGETAARIAHDIRNPVTVARSLAQELASDLTSPLTAEPAALMLEALDRVEHQVRGL